MTVQTFAESLDRAPDAGPFRRPLQRLDAHQHETRNWPCLAEHEITEILVLGEQEPPRTLGQYNGFGIGRTRRQLHHIRDIMSGLPETRHQPRVGAFVGKP
jgi:hypothetical protein